MKRPHDRDDLLRLVPFRDHRLDPPPHERFTDEVLRAPTRPVLLQLSQGLSQLSRGQAITVIAGVVLELSFPVCLVVRFSRARRDLLVDGNRHLDPLRSLLPVLLRSGSSFSASARARLRRSSSTS